MALADPPFDAQHARRRRPDHILAVLAPAFLGAAITLQVVEAVTGQLVLDGELVLVLWTVAVLVAVAWLTVSMEHRLTGHLRKIEGDRYRDGYAAGYLDGAVRANDRQERSHLRPIR